MKILPFKKTLISRLSVFLLACFISLSAYAQRDLPGASSDFSRHSVFLELGGNALAYSLNYDYRFAECVSARGGFTYLGGSLFGGSGSILLLPLMANYLTGSGSSHLEVGIGTILGSAGAGFRNLDENVSGIVGFTGTLGYRLQPRDGGFHFRIGFTPAYVAGFFLPWAGIGFGASF